MIADLDETLRNILREELPVKNSEIDISFEQPKRENSSRWTKPTINLYLYDLKENNVLRQHQWDRIPKGNGSDQLAHLKRTPMRVDCFYMLTTWAADPGDEHRLLTRTLLSLFRFPILPEDRLVGSIRNPPYDIQTRLASHDKLTNPAEVWSSLDNEIRPSISYIVTLALDPWKEVTGPIVQTRTLRTGQSDSLPRYQKIMDDTMSELVQIGGHVRGKNKDQFEFTGIEVALKGTGFFDKTDETGRFTLSGIPPGKYTLVAWRQDGKSVEKSISIPAVEGDYDLRI
jgi:hypothetical protein